MANIIADHGHNVTLFRPYHIVHNTTGLVKNPNIKIIDYFPDHYDELVNTEAETFPMFWDDPLVNHPILQAVMAPKIISGAIERTATQLFKDENILNELKAMNFDVFLDDLNTDWTSFYQSKVFEKAVGHSLPDWKDLVRKSPIYMTNSNPYLDFAVPTTATVVHVGGITMDLEKMRNPAPLPEDYEKILQERESTVLISFGSVIRSFQMPKTFKEGIIKMFNSLPEVTFIWKYEKDDVDFQKRLPKNVHLKKWVPQPALLADKRLKAFVTHGGLGSTTEVSYSGKPALMVPIFGDQPHNADMLARHGGAIAFSKYDLQNGEKLIKAIKALVYDPIYKENAEALFDVLSHQPIDPKVNLMKHLEFAMRFPNHRSQVPAINQSGIIAQYYLDVLLFLILLIVFCLFFVYRISFFLLNCLTAKKNKIE